MAKQEFKYTTRFEIQANLLSQETIEENKYNSKASLDNLRSLFPDQEEIEADTDLLYVAFNLFTANLVNKNDDGVLKDDAIKMAPGIVKRYANIEHNRWDVIGHNIDYGYSRFEDSEIIEKDKIHEVGEFEIFNVAAVTVVYKAVDQYFCEILKESSDPLSYLYNEYSTSFEVGFNDYILALGSKKLADAELITDVAQIKEMSRYLTAEGGTGFMPDGTPLYRCIKEGRTMGLGFVRRPAGSVKGLVSASEKEKDFTAQIKEKINESISNSFEELIKLTKKDKEKQPKEQEIAASEEKSVTKSVNTKQRNIMITDLKDLTEGALEAKEISASSIRDIHNQFVNDTLEKASKDWNDKLEAEKEGKEQAVKAMEEAQARIKEQDDKIEKLEKDLEELRTEASKVKKESLFQERMSAVNEKYDLDKDMQKVVATQLGALDDSDDSFNKWLKDFEVLASRSIKQESEEVETPESKASDALETVEKEAAASIPNSTSVETFKTNDFLASLKKSMGLKS